ncbi:MAG: lantibiotic dehydratase [Mucilaginibacter sp.]
MLVTEAFQQAIHTAAPVFYKALAEKNFDFNRLTVREQHTLWAYFNRMSNRPTPFGFFSGFTALTWGHDSPLKIQSAEAFITPGFETLIENKQATDSIITYHLNQTIYQVGGELRFIGSEIGATDHVREFSLQSVDGSPLMAELIKFCVEPRTDASLVQFLKEQGVTLTDANELLSALKNMQFLLPDSIPGIIGQDYFRQSFFRIPGLFNDTGDKIPPEVVKRLLEVHSAVYVNQRWQVEGSLEIKLQSPILKAVDALIALSTGTENESMKRFVAAFSEKYPGQLLPLMYVLDPQTGIGYGTLPADFQSSSPLLHLLGESAADKNTVFWGATHRLLLQKWSSAKNDVIELDQKDIASLRQGAEIAKLPSTIAVLFRLTANGIWLESTGGVSASALFGRFTHFDDDIYKLCRQIAQKEQEYEPDSIFADIAHFDDLHTANISRRLNTYDYEIPVLTVSRQESKQQVLLSDLMVTVRGKDVILWSKRLQKRVIPRLTSAYNHERSALAAFRFLVDVQAWQRRVNLNLELSLLFPDMPSYPRVQYGDCILYPKTWIIDHKSFNGKFDALQSTELLNILQERGIPERIILTQRDQQLVINTALQEDISFLCHFIRKNKQTILKEDLGLNPIAVQNTNGMPMSAQFAAAAYLSEIPQSIRTYAMPQPLLKPVRHVPGLNWLYLKLYVHENQANELLTESVNRQMINLRRKGLIRSWYFIRYRDPDHHLRIRLKINKRASQCIFEIILKFNQSLLERDQVQRIQFDTYEPEIGRYSTMHMNDFEEIFAISSQMVIRQLSNNSHEETLICVTVVFIRNVMQAAGIDVKKRLSFFKNVINAFMQEFNVGRNFRITADRQFRELRQHIALAIAKPGEQRNSLPLSLQKKLIYLRNNTQPEAFERHLADIIHMHVNRLFNAGQRKYELTAYYMVCKYEEAEAGKQRHREKVQLS